MISKETERVIRTTIAGLGAFAAILGLCLEAARGNLLVSLPYAGAALLIFGLVLWPRSRQSQDRRRGLVEVSAVLLVWIVILIHMRDLIRSSGLVSVEALACVSVVFIAYAIWSIARPSRRGGARGDQH